MSGTDVGQYEGRGINYRALDDLFELNRERHAEVGGCCVLNTPVVAGSICVSVGVW